MKTYEELMKITSDIPANFHDGTFEMLYKYMKDLPEGDYLDFGTGLAKSVIFTALLNPKLRITTFDTALPYNFIDYNKAMEESMNLHGVYGVNHFMADSLKLVWDTELVGMYIDSGHRYEETLKELQIWIPWVKKNGIIILDDYLDDRVDVKRAADEYIESNKDKVKVLEYKMGLVMQKL
jgi:hypothetical protein